MQASKQGQHLSRAHASAQHPASACGHGLCRGLATLWPRLHSRDWLRERRLVHLQGPDQAQTSVASCLCSALQAAPPAHTRSQPVLDQGPLAGNKQVCLEQPNTGEAHRPAGRGCQGGFGACCCCRLRAGSCQRGRRSALRTLCPSSACILARGALGMLRPEALVTLHLLGQRWRQRLILRLVCTQERLRSRRLLASAVAGLMPGHGRAMVSHRTAW